MLAISVSRRLSTTHMFSRCRCVRYDRRGDAVGDEEEEEEDPVVVAKEKDPIAANYPTEA